MLFSVLPFFLFFSFFFKPPQLLEHECSLVYVCLHQNLGDLFKKMSRFESCISRERLGNFKGFESNFCCVCGWWIKNRAVWKVWSWKFSRRWHFLYDVSRNHDVIQSRLLVQKVGHHQNPSHFFKTSFQITLQAIHENEMLSTVNWNLSEVDRDVLLNSGIGAFIGENNTNRR